MKRFFLILPLLCAFGVNMKAQDFYDPYASPSQTPDSIRIVRADVPEIEKQAIDTIPSSDKYIKIVLYDDFTWEYIDEGHPVIDTAGFYEGWSTEMIHAFRGESLENFPDSLDLRLVDSLHNYSAPFLGKVHSGFKFRGRRPHYGIDLPLSVGDTIRAAFDGIVRYSGRPSETGGYGNLIVIRHDNGLETYYGHLSARLVNVDDPVKAGEFARLTGVDALAVSVGNAHGVYAKEPHIDVDRLVDICGKTEVPLVLHGGSGTPKIPELIDGGIRKININADFQIAFRTAISGVLQLHPCENLYSDDLLMGAIESIREVAVARIRDFRSANRV